MREPIEPDHPKSMDFLRRSSRESFKDWLFNGPSLEGVDRSDDTPPDDPPARGPSISGSSPEPEMLGPRAFGHQAASRPRTRQDVRTGGAVAKYLRDPADRSWGRPGPFSNAL